MKELSVIIPTYNEVNNVDVNDCNNNDDIGSSKDVESDQSTAKLQLNKKIDEILMQNNMFDDTPTPNSASETNDIN